MLFLDIKGAVCNFEVPSAACELNCNCNIDKSSPIPKLTAATAEMMYVYLCCYEEKMTALFRLGVELISGM